MEGLCLRGEQGAVKTRDGLHMSLWPGLSTPLASGPWGCCHFVSGCSRAPSWGFSSGLDKGCALCGLRCCVWQP